MSGRTPPGIQQRRRTWRRLWLLALALAACDARPPAASDPYDPATMDFKSPPARITTARQTGAFAAGNALSMTATLKPLDPAPVKEVRLDTTHKIIEICAGREVQRRGPSATRCRDQRSAPASATRSASR